MLTFCCRWRRLVRWHLKGGSPRSVKKGEEGNPRSKLMTKSPRPKPARIPSFCVTSALRLLCAKNFFTLRASEYLPPQDLGCTSLRGMDLEFFAEGRRCSLWEATTIVLQLREAKNDQFARGQVRTHHITGTPLCPIISLRERARHNPEWLRSGPSRFRA